MSFCSVRVYVLVCVYFRNRLCFFFREYLDCRFIDSYFCVDDQREVADGNNKFSRFYSHCTNCTVSGFHFTEISCFWVSLIRHTLSENSYERYTFSHDLTRIFGKSRVKMCNVRKFFPTIVLVFPTRLVWWVVWCVPHSCRWSAFVEQNYKGNRCLDRCLYQTVRRLLLIWSQFRKPNGCPTRPNRSSWAPSSPPCRNPALNLELLSVARGKNGDHRRHLS